MVLGGLVAGCAIIFGGFAYADETDGADGEPGWVSCDQSSSSSVMNQCIAQDGEDGEDGASYIGGDDYYDTGDEYYDSGDDE
jgi:hypothetical protein